MTQRTTKQRAMQHGTIQRATRAQFNRSGAALIVSIVCIAVVAALALAMFRSALLARANRQTASDRLQAAWLAEAGI